MAQVTIRPATIDDAALILRFITELAIYEKAEHEVHANEADIRESLFGSDSNALALICMEGDEAIGYAVYFYNYSTWLGKRGLYLEDLYITPARRGVGAGKTLLRHLARTAVEQNCGRFEWSVLDWNTPAIEFYQSIGAQPQNEWIGYRLDGERLIAFANN